MPVHAITRRHRSDADLHLRGQRSPRCGRARALKSRGRQRGELGGKKKCTFARTLSSAVFKPAADKQGRVTAGLFFLIFYLLLKLQVT